MDPKFSVEMKVIDEVSNLILSLENTLYKKSEQYAVEVPEGAKPLVCYTATTGMREFIGRMLSEDMAEGYCGGMQKFKVNNHFNYKKGERVIISEHLKLNGQPEYLVTKHNIVCGDLNFINIGYEINGSKVIKVIIDIVTGKWQCL